ncbi:hypothetical protein R3P38DRAFT_3164666 [Favolaschia claudopus]|uniref:Uncharacterized protein n=1 Tax=Favolaschia claudopus TaxID=2862362 RepID=A0AAW0EHY7_9AGAR
MNLVKLDCRWLRRFLVPPNGAKSDNLISRVVEVTNEAKDDSLNSTIASPRTERLLHHLVEGNPRLGVCIMKGFGRAGCGDSGELGEELHSVIKSKCFQYFFSSAWRIQYDPEAPSDIDRISLVPGVRISALCGGQAEYRKPMATRGACKSRRSSPVYCYAHLLRSFFRLLPRRFRDQRDLSGTPGYLALGTRDGVSTRGASGRARNDSAQIVESEL